MNAFETINVDKAIDDNLVFSILLTCPLEHKMVVVSHENEDGEMVLVKFVMGFN